MKKIMISMLALFAFTAIFVSCGDDDEVRHSQSASEAIIGTYVGTWTKTASGTSTELTDGCSVTIDAGQTVNDVKVTTTCSGDDQINSKECVANVTWAGNNVVLGNKTKTGTLGVEISGIMSEDGSLTVTFYKSVRSGRKTVETDYKFVGTKQL